MIRTLGGLCGNNPLYLSGSEHVAEFEVPDLLNGPPDFSG
jgi:hypothetical protein